MSEISEDAPVKLKEPRKPRPSEIAAKKAKAAKLKAKRPAKKKTKPKRHKKQGPKAQRPAKRKAKARKPAAVVARPARIDLRLTKTEKAKLTAKAKATRRTITSVVAELIEKMR